jgi:hypothetical protein
VVIQKKYLAKFGYGPDMKVLNLFETGKKKFLKKTAPFFKIFWAT